MQLKAFSFIFTNLGLWKEGEKNVIIGPNFNFIANKKKHKLLNVTIKLKLFCLYWKESLLKGIIKRKKIEYQSLSVKRPSDING